MATGWKTLTVPAKLHHELKRAALDDGRTLGDVVVESIVQWLEVRLADMKYEELPGPRQIAQAMIQCSTTNEPAPYRPFLGCGWDDPADGTCAHPDNRTPECHQHVCPIRPAAPGREEPPPC